MWTWAADGTTALDAAISRAGKSYAEVGRSIGVSGSLVSRWCAGKRTPTPDHLHALCSSLGVSADTILGIQPIQQGLEEAAKRVELIGRELQSYADVLRGGRS